MATEEISHPLFAALYDSLAPIEWLLAPHRRYLAAGLSGRVLDLGAGTGAMFPHVANERARTGTTLEYHAIEPDPHMRQRAARAAEEASLSVEIRGSRAESLPYPDGHFDVVIAGMVFCTIEDPDTALSEVTRVLKPAGEFRFLEHVRADGWRGSGQRLLNPIWERVAGGCQLHRDTIARFVGHDSLSVEEIDRLSVGTFPATPMIRGTLSRRAEDGASGVLW